MSINENPFVVVDVDAVRRASIAAFALGNQFGYDSPEVMAACLRRAAAASCPCTPQALERLVMASARGITADPPEAFQERIKDMLDRLVSYGDLVEERAGPADAGSGKARILNLAPPGFVLRASGAAFLLGIVRDIIFPGDLRSRARYSGHTRMITPLSGEDLCSVLRDVGLVKIQLQRWLWKPNHQEPAEHVAAWDRRLATTCNPGDLTDLSVLDPTTSPGYYKGRWKPKMRQTGRFVARRPQAYGAPIWCYVELDRGTARHLLDFPCVDIQLPGYDEAWRLQMAIDARNNKHQRFRLIQRPDSRSVVIALFSPIPSWVQRRWDNMGTRVNEPRCLLAYNFPEAEVVQETEFLEHELWHKASSTTAGTE